MRFYYIDDDYINYLRKAESLISDNKSCTRPYVGIIIQVNQIDFYVPLSSPKAKHKNMNNSKDFRKINGGQYGVINLNLMIPAPTNVVHEIDFSSIQDYKYRRLLQNQYKCIKQDWQNITNAAQNLYNLYLKDDKLLDDNDLNIKKRCCNFSLFINYADKYNLNDKSTT